jgi:hypothetical protein
VRQPSAIQQRKAAIPLPLVTADTLQNRKTELDVMIARRAFELFEGRGGGHDHDFDDWITAGVEVLRPSVELVRFRPERCESEACRLAERGES